MFGKFFNVDVELLLPRWVDMSGGRNGGVKVGVLESCWLGLLPVRVRGRVLHGFDGGGDGVNYVCGLTLLVVPWSEDGGEGSWTRRWRNRRRDRDWPMDCEERCNLNIWMGLSDVHSR